jgi:hypothetical protein
MPKPTPNASAETLALYEKLVASIKGITYRGAALKYTSLNGHMFSMLTAAGFVSLRLPDGDRETFLKKYKTELTRQYGIVQKEYVKVPDALLKKTAQLKPWFSKSHKYVASLKPK